MDLLIHSDGRTELYHYGVLGMKWGVRRDRSGTINKAYKKLSKLDNNVEKTTKAETKAAIKASKGVSKKYAKLQTKADTLQAKADKKKYGMFSNKQKADELQRLVSLVMTKLHLVENTH